MAEPSGARAQAEPQSQARAPAAGRNQGLAARRAEILAALEEARTRTYFLVEPLAASDYRSIHHPALGPIAWDVAHIGQQEDQWLVQTLGGREETRAGFNQQYDAYKNPRDTRVHLPLLSLDEVRIYHDEVRAHVVDVLGSKDIASAGPLWHDLFVHKMVWIHEHQHNETILQHLQAMPAGAYKARGRLEPPKVTVAGKRLAGFSYLVGTAFPMGQPAHTAATFDNEWPQLQAKVASFWLARTPATNAQFLRFVEAGGYEEKAWWHPDGWAEKEKEDWRHPAYWSARPGAWSLRVMDEVKALPMDHPVCNISWYEADAFARWAGCRLPTETEWERAATWDPHTRAKQDFPWGSEPLTRAHANTDHLRYAPDPVGSHPAGASPEGVQQLIGDVWEWTSSTFEPYTGFQAFPYDDYSARFFGNEYRVLRGGSWASRPGCHFGTFRNWDWPIRRQIFAGVRLAADAPDPSQPPQPTYTVQATP